MAVRRVGLGMKLLTGQKEGKRKRKRTKTERGETGVLAGVGRIKESAGFSTWGGIDAILDAATYEQVCCVWSPWPRLHFLHGYTSDWGASEPGRERQASTSLRPKMKGQPHCRSFPRTSGIEGGREGGVQPSHPNTTSSECKQPWIKMDFAGK